MNRWRIIRENARALTDFRHRRTQLAGLPTWFWIEPTNHCNLRCIMCPNGADRVEVPKGYMDLTFYRRIVDQIRPHASAITLAVGGESLLHPDFPAMARYAADQGIKVLLNTNATLLRGRRLVDLLDCGLAAISFAFDGYTKEAYEKARRGAEFEETLDNILAFLRLKKQKGFRRPYTVLSMLQLGIEDGDHEDRQSFLARFNGLLDEVRLRAVSSWGATFKNEAGFAVQDSTAPHPPCSRLWSTAVIAWNGDVLPCIYNANHEYVLGNLRDEDFSTIWNGPAIRALRAAMLDGTYLDRSPLCEHCIVLGTPPIIGIPSGLRLTLADAATNIFGYGFERAAIAAANLLRHGHFPSATVRK